MIMTLIKKIKTDFQKDSSKQSGVHLCNLKNDSFLSEWKVCLTSLAGSFSVYPNSPMASSSDPWVRQNCPATQINTYFPQGQKAIRALQNREEISFLFTCHPTCTYEYLGQCIFGSLNVCYSFPSLPTEPISSFLCPATLASIILQQHSNAPRSKACTCFSPSA